MELKRLSKNCWQPKNGTEDIFAVSTTKWRQLLFWVLWVCEKAERKEGNYSWDQRPQPNDRYGHYW